MTKSELRATYLKKRNLLSAAELASQSQQIAGRFFETVKLQGIHYLHIFIPIKKFNEINTRHIYRRIWTEYPQIKTVVPRVNFTSGEMEHIAFTAETRFTENKWGITEPDDGESVDAAEIDLVLMPLLCIDERGYRIGYGKGFYDKFLSRCRPNCEKIGLSYFLPVATIADASAHDVRLDRCITPEKTFSFTN